MIATPFGFTISSSEDLIENCDRLIERRLSDLRGYFRNEEALENLIREGDPVAYRVYEARRPEVAGELPCGLSVVLPGLVGDEYFMTKGHYHAVRESAEVYLCLKGRGLLLMENAEGAWAAEELIPNRAVYVSPGWAHRSINTSLRERLVTFFVYPGHAGHDYAAIERSGFRKLVVCRDGVPQLIDNPSWLRTTEEVA